MVPSLKIDNVGCPVEAKRTSVEVSPDQKKRITHIHLRVLRGISEYAMRCPGFKRVDGEGNL